MQKRIYSLTPILFILQINAMNNPNNLALITHNESMVIPNGLWQAFEKISIKQKDEIENKMVLYKTDIDDSSDDSVTSKKKCSRSS